MRTTPSLSLRKETLTELRTADLAAVAAGRPIPTAPVTDCLGFNTQYGTCSCCTASHSCEA